MLAGNINNAEPVESRGQRGDVVHQGHPLREVARVRQAPRMTTLFAPALRTACRSEAEFERNVPSPTFGKAGCTTHAPVDADLEFAVVMHSILFQSSLILIKPARRLPPAF